MSHDQSRNNAYYVNSLDHFFAFSIENKRLLIFINDNFMDRNLDKERTNIEHITILNTENWTVRFVSNLLKHVRMNTHVV